jgi:uncharacterized protein (TIGR01777 family)
LVERVVVSGGTGYVGRALVRRLVERGAEIVVLSRSGSVPSAFAELASVRVEAWDGLADGVWSQAVDGAAAVVHLAGEQAVGKRYTERVKRGIFDSRVKGAEALVRAIEQAKSRPRVFVSASGVGYYGARDGDAPLTEDTPPGTDFLASVCVAWEAAARAAEPFGVRVVVARLGVVLGRGGGPLATMALPFKLLVGGPLGSGRQVFSWVHLDDAVAAFERCLDDASLSGPVNVAAPNAVTQKELARELGRALHRPSFMPAPSFALRALFGEGAQPILTGQRPIPDKLERAGFRFRYPTIEAALAEAVG